MRVNTYLLLACLLAATGGCCHPLATPKAGPTTAPSANSKTLNILTWNVWLLPSVTCQSPRNKKRAAAIADELLERNFDVVCLQKVFDGPARRVLVTALSSRYHAWGPANSCGSLKVNSGLMVFSKQPLAVHDPIQFRSCTGIECMSRKGAMMLTGTYPRPFHIIATHLQGEENPGQIRNGKVRRKQMEQIRRELLDEANEDGAPVFLCGDFNTSRRDPADPSRESQAYRDMLSLFGARNGGEYRVTLDDNRWRNELAVDNTGRTAELDYILVRPNSANFHQLTWRRLILRNKNWDGGGGRRDLSYRYAVALSAEFE